MKRIDHIPIMKAKRRKLALKEMQDYVRSAKTDGWPTEKNTLRRFREIFIPKSSPIVQEALLGIVDDPAVTEYWVSMDVCKAVDRALPRGIVSNDFNIKEDLNDPSQLRILVFITEKHAKKR